MIMDNGYVDLSMHRRWVGVGDARADGSGTPTLLSKRGTYAHSNPQIM